MAKLQSLRARHAAIEYRGYDASYDNGLLRVSFDFLLHPDIAFTPRITLPIPPNAPDLATLQPYLYELGLIELVSYWKAACPGKIIIRGPSFSLVQHEFWKLVYREGLGEFYYVNGITPDETVLPKFEFVGSNPINNAAAQTATIASSGSLLMVSGGKDTACLLDLYAKPELKEGVTLFHLKADTASTRLAALFGFPAPLLGLRTIDPRLILLNAEGYFNGHTPFSAYLAFTGLLVARIWGKKNIVVANESSANEESFVLNGIPVNHQFSKSFVFETAFRRYAAAFCHENYFSVMRALTEEQICGWFATLSEAHPIFRSCNRAAKHDTWCGACPKCAFVALMLGSFLGVAGLRRIFGFNPFEHNACVANCLLLLQQGGNKPLDCVGTYRDCQLALLRFKERFPEDVPAALQTVSPSISSTPNAEPEHYIPFEVLNSLTTLVPHDI